MQGNCQLACKPGSVRRIAPPRWPFIWDARRRAPQATNPDGDAKTHSAPQPKPRSCAVPIRFCSRRGLPCQPCCQRCGALLPHPFTLALFFGLPRSALLETPNVIGLNRAVCFLWHFPWGCPRRTLSGAVFPWSPDFPPPGKRYDLAAHNAPFGQRPSGQLTL